MINTSRDWAQDAIKLTNKFVKYRNPKLSGTFDNCHAVRKQSYHDETSPDAYLRAQKDDGISAQ
jgi:hypothetical protein